MRPLAATLPVVPSPRAPVNRRHVPVSTFGSPHPVYEVGELNFSPCTRTRPSGIVRRPVSLFVYAQIQLR